MFDMVLVLVLVLEKINNSNNYMLFKTITCNLRQLYAIEYSEN